MIKCTIMRVFMISLIAALFAGAADARQQKPAVPHEQRLFIMIKTMLIAFNNANITGNYTVLRDLASPNFQQANTSARLGEFFQLERNKNIDISPIVLLEPRLLRPASIDARGRLMVEGYFPSKPNQVNFVLAFEIVAGRWRLYALGVNTVETTIAMARHQGRRTIGKRRAAGNGSPVDAFVRRSWPYWTGYDYAPLR